MPTPAAPHLVAAWMTALAAAAGDVARTRHWYVELLAAVVFDRPVAARDGLNMRAGEGARPL